MSLATQVVALATRIGQEIKAVRLAKADDSAVVHNSGAETISGRKTFGSAPLVPIGDLLANPVRRDDARLTDARDPKTHAGTHGPNGSDPVTPAAIGAATAGHSHAVPVPTATAMAVSGATATPQAAGGAQFHRLSTATSVTVAAPDSAVDVQPWTHEITNTASSSVTITLANAYEVGGTGRTRSVIVRAGATAYLFGRMRGNTPRLLSVDDGG